MDLDALSYEELSNLFYGKAILFQQTFGINPAAYFNQRIFFRVRFNLRESEDPDLIRTHSNPRGSVCEKTAERT